MTTSLGRGDTYRPQTWWQRGVARLRHGRQEPAPRALKQVYELLLEHWPGEHLISTLPGGERVRVLARYRHLAWNPDEYAAFRAATRPGTVVFDVGANVGAYTMLFANWVGTGGHVYAFEPGSAARAGLEAHMARNGVSSRVTVCPLAVCDRAGHEAFSTDAPSGANALTDGAAARTEIVETTSLDEFCRRHAVYPDVVKIDVEGAELRVLEGARQVLSRPGVRVFVEFHPASWAACGLAPAQVEARIAALGFTVEALGPEFDPWRTEGVSVRLHRRDAASRP